MKGRSGAVAGKVSARQKSKRKIVRDSDTENKPHCEAVKHAGVETR